MSTTRVYESSSGDFWDLIHDDASDEQLVRHTPNQASGGQTSELNLADFLKVEPHSPQHQAVVALVGSKRNAEQTTRITAYVHEPPQEGGPYIAVILRPVGEPSVTVHKSQAEAERELARQAADLKQTILYRSRGA